MLNSDDLVLRAKDGSQSAFSELVSRYDPLIRSLVSEYGNLADHDDLQQEALIALFSAVNSYEAGEGVSFGLYAKICIRNRLLNVIKKNKANEQFDVSTLRDEEADPEQRLISRESREYLLSSFNSELTVLEKQVLRLYLTDMSYEQIAASLQITAKSVDNAIYRVKAKIRKRI